MIYIRNDVTRQVGAYTSASDIKFSADDQPDIRDAILALASLIDSVQCDLNDALTRGYVSSIGNRYLSSKVRARKFAQALVVCDVTNNPASVIDLGQLVATMTILVHPSATYVYTLSNLKL